MASENEKTLFIKHVRSLPFSMDCMFLSHFITTTLNKGDKDELVWLYEELNRVIESAKDCIPAVRPFERYNYKQPELAKNINVSLRYDILKRDGFKCKLCGRTPTEDNVKLHVDHIKPFSKGGLTRADNLRCLCSDCNLGKKAKYES